MTDNIHFKIIGGYQYEAYYNGISFQKSWHRIKFQNALKLLQVKDDDTILDAACGSGVLTELIAQRSKAKITGVDFSEPAIDFCNNKYQSANVEFIRLDLQENYFSPDSFDKIVMLEVLEHLTPETANAIFKTLYSYLKVGGKLVLSTPNKNSFWPLIEFLLDALKLTPKMKGEQHVKLYNKKTLRRILTDAGFKVTNIETTHFLAPWLSFLGLSFSYKVHAAEQKIRVLPGSLLFAVAEK
jgi:2-polyprenyl-3-methyl-5-hydroxy-6-metoxy-1,4-benzoquinol methylase